MVLAQRKEYENGRTRKKPKSMGQKEPAQRQAKNRFA